MRTLIAGKEPQFSFIVREENRDVMKAVLDFSEENGIQMLCIYGEKGTGKSHLAYLAKEMLMEGEFPMARTLTYFDIIEGAMSWINQGNELCDFYKRFEKWDALILENIHDLDRIKSAQKALINLIHQFWILGKKILITCDKHPEELGWLHEEKIFKKVGLKKPTKDLKRLVLKEYEHIAGVELSEEVRDMLIEHASVIPVLKQTFNRAMFYHQHYGEELSTEFFDKIIKHEKV